MPIPLDTRLIPGLCLLVGVPFGIDQWLQRRRLEAVIRLVQAPDCDGGSQPGVVSAEM